MRRILVLLALGAALAACSKPAEAPPKDYTPYSDPQTKVDLPPQPAAPPAAAVPERYLGTWYSSTEQCVQKGDQSRLEIAPAQLTFHEGGGPVTAVKEETPGDIFITGQISGEGEGPNPFTYHFKLSEDGQTLTDVTYPDSPFKRVRCPSN